MLSPRKAFVGEIPHHWVYLLLSIWSLTSPNVVSAVAHVSTAEDEYKGYRIPKDTVIMCNAWSVTAVQYRSLLHLTFHFISVGRAMLNDEKVYPEPFQFKPERFLTADGLKMNKSVKDPDDIIWGFGRRLAQPYSRLLEVWQHPLLIKNLSRPFFGRIIFLDCYRITHCGFWPKKDRQKPRTWPRPLSRYHQVDNLTLFQEIGVDS